MSDDDEKSPPTGRPPIAIDMDKLAKLMKFDPKRADAAYHMGCSEDTIERRIKEETGLTFREFKDKHMVGTKLGLTQKALSMAQGGDVAMLKACLSHFNGWSDKGAGVQVNVQNNVSQNVNVDLVDIEERIRQLKGELDGKD